MTASTKGTYEYRVTVTRIATGTVECYDQFTKKEQAEDEQFRLNAHWNHYEYGRPGKFEVTMKRIHIKPEVPVSVGEIVAIDEVDPDANQMFWDGTDVWVLKLTKKNDNSVEEHIFDTRDEADDASFLLGALMEEEGIRSDFFVWTDRRYTPPVPVVGMGATASYPQDKYPYQVVAVAPNGKSITVVDIDTDHKGLTRLPDCNGYPVYDHTFTKAEMDANLRGYPQKARLHKDGYFYTKGGTRLHLGCARYYRNYAE